MKSINLAIAAILVLLVTALGLYFMRDKLFNFSNPTATKEIQLANTPLILENVKEMAELFSAAYYSEIVLDTSRTDKGFLMDSKNQIIIVAGGTSHAGTDLSDLNNGNIKISDSSCTVTIPNAEIIRTISNPSDFLIFKEEGKWDPKEVQKLKTVCQQKLRENAIKSDLIEKANKRSISLFTDLLKSLGFKKIQVEIK